MIDFSDKQYDDFLNIGYKSPIEKIVQDISNEMIQKEEQCLMKAVRKVGFVVDKEELYKALKYDRDQYEQGYNDMFRKYRHMLDYLRTRCVEGAEELFDNHQFSLLKIVPNIESGDNIAKKG